MLKRSPKPETKTFPLKVGVDVVLPKVVGDVRIEVPDAILKRKSKIIDVEREREGNRIRQARKREKAGKKKPLLTIACNSSEWLIDKAIKSGQLIERDLSDNPAKVKAVIDQLRTNLYDVAMQAVIRWHDQ
jgi:hypothetical protein